MPAASDTPPRISKALVEYLRARFPKDAAITAKSFDILCAHQGRAEVVDHLAALHENQKKQL